MKSLSIYSKTYVQCPCYYIFYNSAMSIIILLGITYYIVIISFNHPAIYYTFISGLVLTCSYKLKTAIF